MAGTQPNGDFVSESPHLPRPENFDETLAHEDQLEMLESQRGTMGEEAPSTSGSSCPSEYSTPANPRLGIAEENQDEDDDNNNAIERMCANFDFPCCGNTQPNDAIKDDPKELLSSEENAEGLQGGENSTHKSEDTSLADIAARIDALDLETAGEVDGDLSGDDDNEKPSGGSFLSRQRRDGSTLSKNRAPWYREPVYAFLIAACVVFTIAIIVMAILLAGSA